VMILERVPTSLRGALSRWLLEPRTGVFLGNPSARVRDQLWNRAVKAIKGEGFVIQVWSDKNPQGFSQRQFGTAERQFVDLEGMALVRVSRRSGAVNESADTGVG
jgi:CRISPR-associated protein Cas2